MTSSPAEPSFWSALGPTEQAEIKRFMRPRRVSRGEVLIERDSPAETLYIINFGLFDVKYEVNQSAVVEIGAGQLIGEIGFFADAPRTAFVVAARDSEVLEINREEFDELTARTPAILRLVARALGRRLARLASNVRDGETPPRRPLRVTAIVPAGVGEISDEFIAGLRKSISVRTCLLTERDAAAQLLFAGGDLYALANWIAEVERCNEHVICLVDSVVNVWTHAVLRSCDQALLVAGCSPDALNPAETLALELFPKGRRRLIRVEARRSGSGSPSAPWLRLRDVFMVHHVALEDDKDFQSLVRFLTGRAIGYVAGGGGAFGPAHVGIHTAFREHGVVFDIHGGSSVGSAMAAAFSLLLDRDAMSSAMNEMFVRRRALKRLTFPRFGLLDHKVFDEELRLRFGTGAIEDVWKPFFAVATDLSNYSMRVIREGELWQAIRASCAIPGVMPPFFDAAGHMLVDGGVTDNVPVGTMNSLKIGPNLVVDLRPTEDCLFDVDYESIPGRRALLSRAVNPWRDSKRLPPCPSPAAVIQRSIFGNTRRKADQNDPFELFLRPPAFIGSSFMNWDRHADVLDASYHWARKMIETLQADGNPALAAMISFSRKSFGRTEAGAL
jgi:NTE family protein